jgi:glycosyltransferase involved in cell wall biosynthesis
VASPSVVFAASKHKIPVILTLHNYRLICANALLLRDGKICELCINKKFPVDGIRYKCYRNSSLASATVTAITGFHKLFNTWKNKIDTYIALNEFSRSKLLYSSLDIPPGKMITKPNFAVDRFDENLQRENFFLFAGRIVKEKGVHVLAQAFASIPEHKVIIIGDGPEKQILEQQYSSFSNIQFTGQMEKLKVNEYMKRCKAFICPSIWYEGAPLTIIEAFAAGTPVIASRLGAMEESITNGFNGLHFNPGDADDLSKKIKLFIAETGNNDLLYKNARQTYLEKYRPDAHYNAIMKIYQNAIDIHA